MAGLVYHFTCQYPQQSDVLTSLCTFAAGNVVITFVLFTQERLSFAAALAGFLSSCLISV